MKLEENIRLTQLYDLYQELLSQSQKDIMNDYLIFNLTTSEIAQNRKVSRQAVNDAIEKACKKLEQLEGKLHFAEKVAFYEEKLKGRKE